MRNSDLKVLMVPLVVLLVISSSLIIMLLTGYADIDQVIHFMPLGKVITIVTHASIVVTIFYFAISFFNKKIPWSKVWTLRLLADIALVITLSFIGISSLLYLEKLKLFPMRMPHGGRELLYIVPIMMNSLYLVLIETILAMNERNQLANKLQKIEEHHLKMKYGALKTQLDHHFLFNNLSVLSSIIYEDVDKADRFITKFAQVYRYVLSINKRDLVSLEEEIEFIKSYLLLYKFRFEDGFDYQINIESEKLKMQIPPLTLQVLVENAIKHNMVSRTNPLQIDILNEGDILKVKNNLQKREEPMSDSTHTGQSNICEKCELLNVALPVVEVNEDSYSVAITLIPANHD